MFDLREKTSFRDEKWITFRKNNATYLIYEGKPRLGMKIGSTFLYVKILTEKSNFCKENLSTKISDKKNSTGRFYDWNFKINCINYNHPVFQCIYSHSDILSLIIDIWWFRIFQSFAQTVYQYKTEIRFRETPNCNTHGQVVRLILTRNSRSNVNQT